MKMYGQVSGQRRDDDQTADAAEIADKRRRRLAQDQSARTVFDLLPGGDR